MNVFSTNGGGVAIQTWMLDHAFPGNLGTISRQLAYLDAQGGRPKNLQGDRLDRSYFEQWAGTLGAADLLQRAFSSAGSVG